MPERTRRRGWLVLAGVLVLVCSVGGAIALWNAADGRRSDNVASFARAPVGCDTTLDFEATGTFVLYVETSGEFGPLAGACEQQLRFDRDVDDVPVVDATLVDPNGEAIDLGDIVDADPAGYDVGGFVGSAVHTVRIDTPGDHVLTVAPTAGAPFAIAVGRSPDDGVALLRWAGVAAGIAGLVLAGVLLVLGSRRSPTPLSPVDPWSPDDRAWPSSPPGFPVPPPTTGATGPPQAARPDSDPPSLWGPPRL